MSEETKKALLKLVEWCGENFHRPPGERWLTGQIGQPILNGTELLDQICEMGVPEEEIDAALQVGQERRRR